MATAKKRKAEPPEQGMSAFALRKRLLQPQPAEAEAVEAQPAPDCPGQADAGARPSQPATRPAAGVRIAEPAATTAAALGSAPSRREPAVLRSVIRSTAQTQQRQADGRVQLTLAEGERLVVLGSYGVTVSAGTVTLAGATLAASTQTHWVHAPQCHALPVLRPAGDASTVELVPHPAAPSLRKLAQMSPLFARLWNEPGKAEAAETTETTFQILFANEGIARSHDLVAPPEWNKLLAELTAPTPSRRGRGGPGPPIFFVCGPKGSGKSTFSRLLANRLLTEGGKPKSAAAAAAAAARTVAVLDADPGQPEYGPPGTVSLVVVAEPNLAPPFCHPYVPDYGSGRGTRGNRVVRAHDLAAVSPAADPDHYVACVLDLFAAYGRTVRARPPCPPLVVNTPGWVQGTGLELLGTLVAQLRPSRVVYMSQDGPDETVQALRAAAAAVDGSASSFVQLPSQPGDSAPSAAAAVRTAAQLRTMQSLSYFHLDLEGPSGSGGGPLSWGRTVVPLSAMRPWTVPYTGRESGILGILCYDYQPAVDLLADALNGTVVSIVAIEDVAAFGGRNSGGGMATTGNASPATNTNPTRPPLVRSPEGLPLLVPGGASALDPRFSRSLGLALVRGIDTARRALQLLTPLCAADAVDDVLRQGGLGVVLVSGKQDLPTWAYTEDLYFQRAGTDGNDNDNDNGDASSDSDADAEVSAPTGLLARSAAVPWVEALHGSEKRAVGSRVWRVRRDLGRNTAGGGRGGGA